MGKGRIRGPFSLGIARFCVLNSQAQDFKIMA